MHNFPLIVRSHLDDVIDKTHVGHRVPLFSENLLQVLHLYENKHEAFSKYIRLL